MKAPPPMPGTFQIEPITFELDEISLPRKFKKKKSQWGLEP